MRYDAGGSTDAGPSRTANDDHLLLDFHCNLFAVLDAGGSWAEGGGQASRIGAEVLQQVIGEGLASGEDPRPLIERAFHTAGALLRTRTDENGWYGAASVVVALLLDGVAYVAWLGNAVAHHISGGRVESLTRPHTLANAMARRGTLSEAEAATHEYRNVLVHYLGADEFPDPFPLVSISPRPGDWLILTTDGVHDPVPPPEFAAVCAAAADGESCAAELVRRAHAAGSRDNATCAAIAFRGP